MIYNSTPKLEYKLESKYERKDNLEKIKVVKVRYSDFNNSIIRILEKVQNKIRKPVYKKYFSIFCTTTSEFHSKVCKKY